MNQEEVRQTLKNILSNISAACEVIEQNADYEAFKIFKTNVKLLRSFMALVRLHRENSGLILPPKYKKLYALAASVTEHKEELNYIVQQQPEAIEKIEELNYLIVKIKNEWKKTYSKSLIDKQEKQLLDFGQYDKIRPQILGNFFNTHLPSPGMTKDKQKLSY